MKKAILALVIGFFLIAAIPTFAQTSVQLSEQKCPAGMVRVLKGFGSYCVTEQTEKATKKANAQPPQCDTAVMYENQKNYLEATSWYMLCADRGNIDAEYKVGTMYEDGKGVDQSYQMAEPWYKRAAEHGNADAQFKLGSMLEDGKGMYQRQSYEEAASWYKKAAEDGQSLAQYRLGNLYEKGKGVPHDLEQALYWYGKAAAVNDNAKNRLSELNTELEEKQRAQEQARQVEQQRKQVQERRASEIPDPCLALGDVKPDDVKKVMWMVQNLRQPGPVKTELGLMYLCGKGVPKNPTRGVALLRDAATVDPGATTKLALMYARGQGVPLDRVKAFRLLSINGCEAMRTGEPAMILFSDVAKRILDKMTPQEHKLAKQVRCP